MTCTAHPPAHRFADEIANLVGSIAAIGVDRDLQAFNDLKSALIRNAVRAVLQHLRLPQPHPRHARSVRRRRKVAQALQRRRTVKPTEAQP